MPINALAFGGIRHLATGVRIIKVTKTKSTPNATTWGNKDTITEEQLDLITFVEENLPKETVKGIELSETTFGYNNLFAVYVSHLSENIEPYSDGNSNIEYFFVLNSDRAKYINKPFNPADKKQIRLQAKYCDYQSPVGGKQIVCVKV
jgi:hypothetical protein